MMKAVYDKERGGFISLTSPHDGYKAEFLLGPEEFNEYDVEDCQWLGMLPVKYVLRIISTVFYGTLRKTH